MPKPKITVKLTETEVENIIYALSNYQCEEDCEDRLHWNQIKLLQDKFGSIATSHKRKEKE